MPVTTSYPGVYIEELPSGVRPLVGVATSTTAFIGWSPKGPEDDPVRIQSFGDYDRRFGGLDTRSELGLAIQQYFLNGGTDAIIVRVPRQGATDASFTVNDDGGKAALVMRASSSGAWGDLIVVDVDAAGATADTAFNLTITDLASGQSERFVGLSTDPASPRFAPAIINDPDTGSELIDLDASNATAKRPLVSGTQGSDPANMTFAAAKSWKLTIRPDLPGKVDPNDATKWLPDVAAVEAVILAPQEAQPGSMAGWASLVERKINAALAAAAPATYSGYAVKVGPNASGKGLRIVGATTRPGALDSAYIMGGVTESGTIGDFAKVLGLDVAKANPGRYLAAGTVRPGPLAAAAKGNAGTKPPGTAELVGDAGSFTGLHALRRVDLFNLLCIPDATRASAGNPAVQDSDVDANAVWAAAYSICEAKRALLLVDPPPSVAAPDKALDWISSGLTTKGPNAAAYFPRLRIPDPTAGFQPRTVPPSATLAGLFARTDADQGVWKAPAGTEARLRNVSTLVTLLTDGENGVLNPLGLNCLRTFPTYGTVSWGARTTDGADAMASQWKYVPIRRLALMIEESVYRGTQWAVFMPNDEPLWAQLRLNLTAFMHDLFRKGAFAGRSPREAYLVKCDAETTTPADQDRGIVNVLVGFAPLKPAEFVIIRIKQLAGQTTT
jgi:phage tail sheath protein FI